MPNKKLIICFSLVFVAGLLYSGACAKPEPSRVVSFEFFPSFVPELKYNPESRLGNLTFNSISSSFSVNAVCSQEYATLPKGIFPSQERNPYPATILILSFYPVICASHIYACQQISRPILNCRATNPLSSIFIAKNYNKSPPVRTS